jgi:Tat protein secretion system quality control protein TatD with DNase activity
MKLIDAHIHLSDAEYAKRTDELVTDAKEANVVASVSARGLKKTSLKRH